MMRGMAAALRLALLAALLAAPAAGASGGRKGAGGVPRVGWTLVPAVPTAQAPLGAASDLPAAPSGLLEAGAAGDSAQLAAPAAADPRSAGAGDAIGQALAPRADAEAAVLPAQGAEARPSAPLVSAASPAEMAAAEPVLPKAQGARPAASAADVPQLSAAAASSPDDGTSLGQLAAAAADDASGAGSGARFDGGGSGGGSGPPSDGGSAGPGGLPPAGPQYRDLRFTRQFKNKLARSQVYAMVRLVGNRGSRWYWGQYRRGSRVRVLVGGQTMFSTKVERGVTMKISKIMKKDLEGVFPPATIKKHRIAKLRRMLIDDLTAYNRYAKPGKPSVVTLESYVRLIRFMPYREARKLPENIEEPELEPRPRRVLEIPTGLARTFRYLPKAVLIDMRLFPGRVPLELLEDIGKLMKAGVYVVFMSPDRIDGRGSLEDRLTGALSPRERDLFVRHKLIALTQGGNSLAAYRGSFAQTLPFVAFSGADRDLMIHAAQSLASVEVAARRANELTFVLPEGRDPEAFLRDLAESLRVLAFPGDRYRASVGSSEGRPTVTLRPTDMAGSIPHLLKALREHQGLYVNMTDLMVVSRDPALLEATQGAVQPSEHAEGIGGEELVDLSLGALLGPYRENLRGDWAASASKITSFIYDKYRQGGGFSYNVYMLMGHVMHSAFNWAVWSYRNTGAFPSVEELLAKGNEIWDREDAGRYKHMLETPGESMSGYREVMQARLRTMHDATRELLAVYPIVVGTELPNLFIYNRYKGSEFLYRDILRLIYDMVLARETDEGLEIAVVDFKSGQTPTLQNLTKDTQAQLYDHVVRLAWERLSLPYGTGDLRPVSGVKVRFVFPTGFYAPSLNEWSRIKFERFLKNVMNRMRRHNDIPIPKPAPKRRPRRKKS